MPRESKFYLKDILLAIQKIESYVGSADFDQFEHNNMVIEAALFNFIVIGEATKNVSGDIKDRYPEVAWLQIGGLRDVIAHEYFRIKLDVVWGIIRKRLPELREQISKILEAESGS